ncbi:ribosomal protein S18-alanine N-acetyltransferase [Calidifontibacter terrae]
MTSAPMTSRPMIWQDIAPLTALDAELFGHEAWSENTWWAEHAARPSRRYRVVEDEAGIVAYAGVDCPGHDVADVMTIAVVPRGRGSGLARELVTWMRDEAASAGAEALLLEVRADNVAARKLYDRNGFEQISLRRRYYQPEGVDAIIMRALLKEDS